MLDRIPLAGGSVTFSTIQATQTSVVPRGGSILSIQTIVTFRRLERHHGKWSGKARQSAVFLFRRCRSYPWRRNVSSCTTCRTELAGLLYRYARTHSHSYQIASPHLRWHELMRTGRQSALLAFW